jgi:hypothetical protein
MAKKKIEVDVQVDSNLDGSIKQLKELKKELKNASVGSDEFKKIYNQIDDLEDKIKSAKNVSSDWVDSLEPAGGPLGMVGKGINGKQAIGALKLLNSEDRRDQGDLDRGLAKLAGIPTMPGSVTVLDPKGAEFAQLQRLRATAQQIQSQGLIDGKVLTPRMVLQQIETQLEATRNTEGAKAARRTLETVWEKKAGGKITRDSLPALEGGKKFNANEIKAIKRLLDQAEGNP